VREGRLVKTNLISYRSVASRPTYRQRHINVWLKTDEELLLTTYWALSSPSHLNSLGWLRSALASFQPGSASQATLTALTSNASSPHQNQNQSQKAPPQSTVRRREAPTTLSHQNIIVTIPHRRPTIPLYTYPRPSPSPSPSPITHRTSQPTFAIALLG
jgi:hypothetical protein